LKVLLLPSLSSSSFEVMKYRASWYPQISVQKWATKDVAQVDELKERREREMYKRLNEQRTC